MWQSLMNAWLLPDLRKRLLFTAFIIAIYRFGSFVPVPGIDLEVIQNLTAGGGVFGFLNLFAGGALQRMAVFALGIMPYITAVSYTHLRAHETVLDLVCRLLLEKKKKKQTT